MAKRLIIDFKYATSWSFIEKVGTTVVSEVPGAVRSELECLQNCRTCRYKAVSSDALPCSACFELEKWRCQS